jgi:nucleoside-diphosphate-sugar epimerase
MSKLIIGCGYLGMRVARRWMEDGQAVAAVTRSHARADALKRQGVLAIVADIMRPAALDNLPEAQTVLFAAGYDVAGGYSRQDLYVKGLQAALNAISPGTRRIVFISSTSVYGQSEGEWVDESSRCDPITASGKAFLEAEKTLAASRFGPCAIVMRLAGLYGPGRMRRRTKELMAGKSIVSSKERFLNLIHIEDAAGVVIAADKLARPPCRYVIADGCPVQFGDYLAYLAKLLGVGSPAIIEPSQSEASETSGQTNKRVSNAKMLAELGVRLKYPTYREGLEAALWQDTAG